MSNLAVKLQANERSELSKSHTKRIRNNGFIPAIVYGNKKEPINVAVNSIDLLKTVRDEGKNAIISLDIDGKSTDVMLHDYQIEPLKDQIIHADFYIVNMSQEMDVSVPIHLEGEAQGSKDGGVLQQPLYELAVRAKPADIPEEILIDVSKLEIGDTIMVSDLKEGKQYEILEDEDTTIVTISVPSSGPSGVDEEEYDETEPEVIEQDGNTEA